MFEPGCPLDQWIILEESVFKNFIIKTQPKKKKKVYNKNWPFGTIFGQHISNLSASWNNQTGSNEPNCPIKQNLDMLSLLSKCCRLLNKGLWFMKVKTIFHDIESFAFTWYKGTWKKRASYFLKVFSNGKVWL